MMMIMMMIIMYDVSFERQATRTWTSMECSLNDAECSLNDAKCSLNYRTQTYSTRGTIHLTQLVKHGPSPQQL
jgi:hypothetical protein